MAPNINQSTNGRDEVFSSLKSIVLAGAGIVGVVFGLFGSVLQSLVPPTEEPLVTVGWASLTLLVLLIALSTLFRLVRSNRAIVFAVAASGFFAISAVPIFVSYTNDLRTYVVQVPPKPATALKRFIRGDVHAEGVRRLRGRSVDAYASDDVEGVLTTEVLWTRESQIQNSSRLQGKYLLLVLMLSGALFTAALALLALKDRRKRQGTIN